MRVSLSHSHERRQRKRRFSFSPSSYAAAILVATAAFHDCPPSAVTLPRRKERLHLRRRGAGDGTSTALSVQSLGSLHAESSSTSFIHPPDLRRGAQMRHTRARHVLYTVGGIGGDGLETGDVLKTMIYV